MKDKERYQELTFRVLGATLILFGLVVIIPQLIDFIIFLFGLLLVLTGLYFFFIHHTDYALTHRRSKKKKKKI
ncbi:hypothetical protein K9M74_00435 [Candidatus Woesearchaeota archaeon]|nr:hypothetical protein [Candidatus Woesearchaeota archaeon]